MREVNLRLQKLEERDPTVPHDEEWWDTRVPAADIFWTARLFPGTTNQRLKLDVRQLVTDNDCEIHNDLTANALMVKNPEECNVDIFRIYKHSRLKEINPYHYQYDEQIFGCELFMYPYELRASQKGDCDDWGIELASYLITAGVPAWRVRCVAGWCRGGGGHLTVYVLGDDKKTWYHINSTTGWEIVKARGWERLEDFPTSRTEEDTIGIGEVWFSFNNRFAWHQFETENSLAKCRETDWMKNIIIRPRL